MQFRDLQKQYVTLKESIDTAMLNVASSAHFILGPEVKELEIQLADYVGVKHCISCANGTDAISIAMRAWGISKGDAVFVPDFTFFSSGECPADEGATPIFVDVDQRTFNLDPIKLEESIKRILAEGKYKAKAVVAVDLYGLPANYRAIKTICKKYNLLLLEDGAQGFGGSMDGKRACSFGDISITSFFPAKPLGCYGDGGAIFTDNDVWADLIRSICVHGKDTSNPSDSNAKYNNVRLGKNSRLDTLQAAILLPKFKAFIDYELRDVNSVADYYTDGLRDTELILPKTDDGFFSSWAQYTVQLPEKINRRLVQEKLRAAGIPSMVYYSKPLHKQGAFKETDSENAHCPIAEKLCQTVLSLPIDPYKTKSEIEIVITELKKILK